ncbi:MAG: hypothetical protein AAB279_06285, partial [Candidatus Binatota bacterium]
PSVTLLVRFFHLTTLTPLDEDQQNDGEKKHDDPGSPSLTQEIEHWLDYLSAICDRQTFS